MLRRLLIYHLVLRYISVNLETSIGLSIRYNIYALMLRHLLNYHLVLRYIIVNLVTSIGLSNSFKIYMR